LESGWYPCTDDSAPPSFVMCHWLSVRKESKRDIDAERVRRAGSGSAGRRCALRKPSENGQKSSTWTRRSKRYSAMRLLHARSSFRSPTLMSSILIIWLPAPSTAEHPRAFVGPARMAGGGTSPRCHRRLIAYQPQAARQCPPSTSARLLRSTSVSDKRSDTVRAVTVLVWVVGLGFVAVGTWCNVFYSRANVNTGAVTHPYAVVGWLMWLVGMGVCAAALQSRHVDGSPRSTSTVQNEMRAPKATHAEDVQWRWTADSRWEFIGQDGSWHLGDGPTDAKGLSPGWYPDPDVGEQQVRYWDGQTWTQHIASRTI
jgi:hypothetical protein